MRSLASSFVILLMAEIGFAQTSGDFVTDSITTNTLVASSFINDNMGWLADDGGVLWHTANGGQSWTSVADGKYFLKLDFTDAFHGFATTSSLVYKTTDGGNAWSTLNMPGNISGAIYFLNNDTGFISGSEVIYKTTNGGSSWSTINTQGVTFVDYYFLNAATGIAAARDNNSYQCIWRTIDGGATWSNVYSRENYFINAVWFSSEDTGWAVGYFATAWGGKQPIINQTTDGGVTWNNVYLNDDPGDLKGEALTAIRFKNSQEGFALSTYSQSVITSDGGATWNFTHDDNGTAIIPDWGIYKTLAGVNDMYFTGRKGFVTKWQ